MLGRLVDAYPDAVQLTYRHFPLISIHANAQKSAEAAQAAGAQGAFWPYHDLLFERQNDWSSLPEAEARDFFIALAESLELDTMQFTDDLDGDVYADYVSASYQEAINLNLSGTPSIILNGRLLPGDGIPFDYNVWDNFVKEQIQLQGPLKELAERQYDAPPPMTIDEDATYLAYVKMETGGEFVMELLPQSAPQTVNSFVFLANEGWFDGVTFHRVLEGFVAQTGDPSGTGLGNPGYTIPDEIDPDLSQAQPGMVAMANSSRPDTNGSQWYITLGDVSELDGGYTIFGRVIEGMDVVEAITLRNPVNDPNAPPGDAISTITIEVAGN